MIVRLKEHDVVFTFDDVRGFNSMIVRLKVYFESYDNVFHMCFNSMIVRLKDSIVGFPVITCIMFQFYDSPIKRRNSISKRCCRKIVSIL